MYNPSSHKRSTRKTRTRTRTGKRLGLLIPLLLALVVCQDGVTTRAQAPGDGPIGPIAEMNVAATGIEWLPQIEHDGLTLIISGPNDLLYRQAFEPGSVPTFEPVDPQGQPYPDGSYTYELRAVPVIDAETRAALTTARESGDSEAVVAQLQAASKLPQYVPAQSGYFSIIGGEIVTDDTPERPTTVRSPLAPLDVVHNDDVIITGSLCVGFDCSNGEPFDLDTVKLKENNLRLYFEDTSVGSFPTNDWRIVINDATNGGASYFSIEDVDGGARPFAIEAGADSNSIYVDGSGDVGLGTSTPATNLEVVDGGTPEIRLHLDTSEGYPDQRWDLAGNESHFYVRDATNGSKLPFRIQPNTPSNSLSLRSSGYAGFGTWYPAYPIEVETTGEDAVFAAQRTDGTTAKLAAGATTVQIGSVTNHELGFVVNDSAVMTLTTNGNLTLDGFIAELSDANAKENLTAVNGEDVLGRLAGVPITTWNYADDGTVRHMGPMAQDFYAAFGLGPDERHIAPLDTNGVALVAAQELYRIAQAQDAQIAQLEQQNADLEARVAALEALVEPLLQAQRE